MTENSKDLSQYSLKGEPDEFGVVNCIEYIPGPKPGTYIRVGKRLKQIFRSDEAEAAVQKRKEWKRFGNALNAVGPEKGITMESNEEVQILHPKSAEAKKTGSEQLIEKIQLKIQESNKQKKEAKMKI